MNVRIWGIILFSAIGIEIAAGVPFARELIPEGHVMLMAILLVIGLWTFANKWVPVCISSMVMIFLHVTSGLSLSMVFNRYTTRALWILIPALFFGFALNSTGLGKRQAYWIIDFFRRCVSLPVGLIIGAAMTQGWRLLIFGLSRSRGNVLNRQPAIEDAP